MPKRADTKKFLPGVFELPGGHIDFSEEMVVGLKCEIKEEFNMDISVGDPFTCFTYTNEVKGSHSIEVVYFARFIDDIGKIALNPEDHSEYKWFSEGSLMEAYVDSKGEDDIEFSVCKKGFAIIAGNTLNLG